MIGKENDAVHMQIHIWQRLTDSEYMYLNKKLFRNKDLYVYEKKTDPNKWKKNRFASVSLKFVWEFSVERWYKRINSRNICQRLLFLNYDLKKKIYFDFYNEWNCHFLNSVQYLGS